MLFSKSDVILGKYDDKHNALNTILLLYKKYIYEVKMSEGNLNFNVLKNKICNYINIEKLICKSKDKSEEFNKKWDCYDLTTE